MIEIYGVIFSLQDLILLTLFALAMLIQFFYLLLIAIFVLCGRNKVTSNSYPPVSIIITSRNYEDNLKRIVPVLLEQNYPEFQVVVVDDCSTDGTEWYLAGLKIQYPHLKTTRIIQETDFPNALAITVGIRAASKEWLIFLNPLCVIPDKNWLKSYAENLIPEKEVVYGYVNLSNCKGSMNNILRFEIFDSFILGGAAQLVGIPMPVIDVNIAYKREEFLERRGFAAVLESPFSENELYMNKISTRANSTYILNKPASVGYCDEAAWHDLMNFKKKQLLLKQKFTVGQRFYLWVNANSRLAFDLLMIILVILSPLRYWIAGIWLFKNIVEMIWGIVGMGRLGEKNLFPGLTLFKSVSPLINSVVFLNQLFIGNRRKWK
jgi:poly-beta-1,6-N-acetyl-D-glucosamine synthase